MKDTFFSLKISDVRRETPDTVSVALDIPDKIAEEFSFMPGQYVTFKKQLNREELRRSYSICTAPSSGELRVAIKTVPGGKFSTYANQSLHVNDNIDVMPPTGNFIPRINPLHSKTYLFFAAGSGITPVISIITSILENEPLSQILLLYGNRRGKSIIFKEQLHDLKDQYMTRFLIHHFLSQEERDNLFGCGRIGRDKCDILFEKLLPPEEVDEAFICGPLPMLEEIRDYLQEHGLSKDNIHYELFTPPDEDSPADKRKVAKSKIQADSNIKVIIDGKSFEFHLDDPEENILDAANSHGADLPYSCKGGVCSTCKAKLIEGEVEMDVNYALEEDEVEEGYVLTCQSHPVSEKVTLNFDV